MRFVLNSSSNENITIEMNSGITQIENSGNGSGGRSIRKIRKTIIHSTRPAHIRSEKYSPLLNAEMHN